MIVPASLLLASWSTSSFVKLGFVASVSRRPPCACTCACDAHALGGTVSIMASLERYAERFACMSLALLANTSTASPIAICKFSSADTFNARISSKIWTCPLSLSVSSVSLEKLEILTAAFRAETFKVSFTIAVVIFLARKRHRCT